MSARNQANQANQAAPYTRRPGWEDEPITVPPPWRWMALGFLLALLGFTFTGCATPPPGFVAATEPPPALLAGAPAKAPQFQHPLMPPAPARSGLPLQPRLQPRQQP